MNKNTVTIEQVKENMQDVIVRTLDDFGKPCTYVTVRMKNGFTLRESTTCVDPANYDEEIGKKICLEKIEDKIWFLLGYALQDKVSKCTFKEALEALKNGAKIKLPEWKGYWQKEGDTIIMHCKDGRNLDINGQMDDVFFTMDNIAHDDWQILDSSYTIE
jgi:hypothetical protein